MILIFWEVFMLYIGNVIYVVVKRFKFRRLKVIRLFYDKSLFMKL